MNSRDQWPETHDFWNHFWCGLVVGTVGGAITCYSHFSTRLGYAVASGAIGLTFAVCCGYWGGSA